MTFFVVHLGRPWCRCAHSVVFGESRFVLHGSLPADRSCHEPVVSSRSNHGAQETFLAQEGVREEGRQEEVPPLVEAPQREEGQLQASLPQAQVEEGR